MPVLDNFERAKTQGNMETDREEKTNNSYQIMIIYNNFIEMLNSLGVEDIETVGGPFDPMAISTSKVARQELRYRDVKIQHSLDL